MKKKGLIAFVLVFVLSLVCAVWALPAFADEAEYSVRINDTQTYPMSGLGDGTYEYDNPNLSANTLYKIEVVGKDGNSVANALLYKKSAGKIKVGFKSDTQQIDVMYLDEGKDVIKKNFDFKANPYRISVDGGIVEGRGEFSSCILTSFYYPEYADVKVSASLTEDQGVVNWENNISKNWGDASAIIVKAEGSEKNITLKAVRDYLPIDKLIEKKTEITLKKNYEVKSPIKLEGTKTYTIDIGSFSIKGDGCIFEINGASLIIKGSGSIERTAGAGGAVKLSSGALTVSGVSIVGHDNAIYAEGGALTLNSGKYDAKTGACVCFGDGSSVVASINGGTYNERSLDANVGSDTALLIKGGELTVNGGTFYGERALWTDGSSARIKILTGTFYADNFEKSPIETEKPISSYIDESSTFEGDSAQGYNVVPKPPKYPISVTDGVLSNGYDNWEFEAGEKITLKPIENVEGMEFECWEILSGKVEIADLTSREISFTMPEEAVLIKAKFKLVEVVPPVTSDVPTQPPMTEPIAPETEEPERTEEPMLPETEDNSGKKAAGGSLAIIVLIIILIALLIAAIIVSVILIIRNYNLEREAAELGDSVVDSLADKLSEIDFTSVAGAGAASESAAPMTRQNRRGGGGIDFDAEMELHATQTAIATDAAAEAAQQQEQQDTTVDSEESASGNISTHAPLVGMDQFFDDTEKNAADTKLRRPKRPVQRPDRKE